MNNDKIVNQVLQTNVHSIFKRQKGNRPINKNHLDRLILSMKKKYLISPILVNEKMEVIDGQHRLQAQKELNLPTYYIKNKGYGIEETRIFNQNSNNWTANNFMEAFCDLGMPEYIKYKKFQKKYKFNLQCTMNLLMGNNSSQNGNVYEIFKAGLFKVTSLKQATKIAESVLEIGEYYLGYKRRSFITAIQKSMSLKEYNHKYFLKKLKSQRTRMVDCTSWKQYLTLMEDIYNYRTMKEKRIRLYI